MRKWYPWLLVGFSVLFSIVMYSRLPEMMPTHWNLRGEVNGYSSRTWGVWLMPAVLLAMAIILPRIPTIDPRRENYEKFRPSYDLVVNTVMTLITVLHVATLGVGAGWPVPIERVTPVLIGTMFVVIGNVLPRARPNWLFGIRTPWTLTNDRVWERTHRVGGFLFVIGGLVVAIGGLVLPAAFMPTVIVGMIVAAVLPVIYSYFTWRKEANRA